MLEYMLTPGQISSDRLNVSPLSSLAKTVICTRDVGECGPAYRTVLPLIYRTEPWHVGVTS